MHGGLRLISSRNTKAIESEVDTDEWMIELRVRVRERVAKIERESSEESEGVCGNGLGERVRRFGLQERVRKVVRSLVRRESGLGRERAGFI